MNLRCHACNAEGMRVVLDLGLQPLNDRLLEPYELGEDEPRWCWRLAFCPACQTLQRADPPPPGLPPAETPSPVAETVSLADHLRGLKASLPPRGGAAVQFPYAGELDIPALFGRIHHRQASLFTVQSIRNHLEAHGLDPIQVEQCPGEPALLRVFIGHRGDFPVGESVARWIAQEESRGTNTWDFWQAAGARIDSGREALLTEIRAIRAAGQRLCGYGIGPAGHLLLNHCGLGREGFDGIDFVLDPSGRGVGRLTPGSHLPILPVDELEKRFIKVIVLLDPQLALDLERQTEAWRARGGRILDPWSTTHRG
jgi:hypothetical protein